MLGHTREVLALSSHNGVFSVRQIPSGLDTLAVLKVDLQIEQKTDSNSSLKQPVQEVGSNS